MQKLKKGFVCFCVLFIFCSFGNILYAKENIEDRKGYIPDALDNGYESWYPQSQSKTRGFENTYKRSGTFKVLLQDEKTIYDATSISVPGWPDYSVRYYVPALGRNVVESEYYNGREITTYESKEFITLCTLNGYTQPYDLPAFDSNIDIPAGTYVSTRQSADLVEITYNGKAYWVSPQYNGSYAYVNTNRGYFKDVPGVLGVSKVNGIPVYQKLMPLSDKGRTGFKMRPKYVTIHNTANAGYGADALAHANLQMTANNNTSWHFTVDNKQIYQSMPMDEVGWHAGDGLLAGNGATVAIEICENADGNYAQAERNAAYLAAEILYENGLPSDALRLHNDWSGKHCAHNIMDKTKGSMGWSGFKSLVKQEYDRIVLENDLMNTLDKTIPDGFADCFANTNLVFEAGIVTGSKLGADIKELQNVLTANNPNLTVQVTNAKGETVSGKVRTGLKVVMTDSTQKTFTFAIAVKGDVNGDGEIYATDYVKIKNHIMGTSTLSPIYQKAADVNGDKYIYATDYVKIKNYIMGKGTID